MEQNRLNRREFLATGALAAGVAGSVFAAPASRKMTIDLSCGAIGVKANLAQAIDLAARYRFEAVDPDGSEMVSMSDGQITDLLGLLKSKNLVFGAAGLPVEFRRDEARFKEDLKKLPAIGTALHKGGVTRIGTWIMPNHAELTYLQNLRLHATRLRETADLLADSGLKLGLEYVGPKTLWTAARYPFIHTMAELRDLLAEINRPNVGFVLDSWHAYTSGDKESDLLSLKGSEVVVVDLNDAPEGVPVDQQVDSKRRLPAATGVIDVKTFLSALVRIGYDGPVRAEPFDDSLRKMAPDEAVRKTSEAMHAAFATLG